MNCIQSVKALRADLDQSQDYRVTDPLLAGVWDIVVEDPS